MLLLLASPATSSAVAQKAKEPTQEQSATQPAPLPYAALDGAIERRVNVEMKSGHEFIQATLLAVRRDNSGQPVTIRIQETQQGRKRTISTRSIWTITYEAKPIYEAPSNGSSAKDSSRRTSRAQQRSERETAEREQWLARLKARGVKPWPEINDQQRQRAIEKHKQFAQEVRQSVPSLRMVETGRFLFCSNIPPQQIRPYIATLDKMYDMMCGMYGVKLGTPVWRGKALVVAFLEKEQFVAFEQKYMDNEDTGGAYGLCHNRPNGDVIISCYRGDRPSEFAKMLVHETSHGFIHRYKTPVRLPSWVNEGMADWIADKLVPEDKSVERQQKAALNRMRQSRYVGDDFFKTRGNIEFSQYGIASSLTAFLIQLDARKYAQFIQLMKEGVPCEESLRQVYDASLDGLLTAYGRAIGVPDLRH